MRDRRDTRPHRAPPQDTHEPGSPEELKIPPPSVALMDHLWKRYGERPCLADTLGAPDQVQAAFGNMAVQDGIEQVLNYLEELLHGTH